jgi:hypothetical protein
MFLPYHHCLSLCLPSPAPIHPSIHPSIPFHLYISTTQALWSAADPIAIMRRQRAQSVAIKAQAEREAEEREQAADAAREKARQRAIQKEADDVKGGGGSVKLMNEDGDELEGDAAVTVDAEGRRCVSTGSVYFRYLK